jgi:hypothetical protein
MISNGTSGTTLASLRLQSSFRHLSSWLNEGRPRALGRGWHDHLGIFQTALLGRITPASTADREPGLFDRSGLVSLRLLASYEVKDAGRGRPNGMWRDIASATRGHV